MPEEYTHEDRKKLEAFYEELNNGRLKLDKQDFIHNVELRVYTELCLDKENKSGGTILGNWINIIKEVLGKFINDEKLYEWQRRTRRGELFKTDEEARDSVLKALAKRSIDYLVKYGAVGDMRQNEENLRVSLESWF